MSTLEIVLAVLVVVLLLAWVSLRQRGTVAKAEAATDRIDTVIGWPPKATRVLSGPERIAFGMLVRTLPEYMVLAQVPVSRFVNVPKRNSYADWLRRVGYQCVDFVVCDMAAQVIAVVELQSPQASDQARKRLVRITRTLKAAQIPLLVWRDDALPAVDSVREAILPKAAAAPETAPARSTAPIAPMAPLVAPPGAAAGAAAAAPQLNPFDELDRDSTQDEMIELLEPPASTWFDELDSGPTPLKKR